MPTLLQLNECLNISIGKIAQFIGEVAMRKGWESFRALVLLIKIARYRRYCGGKCFRYNINR